MLVIASESEMITLEANTEKELLLNIVPVIICLNVIYNGEYYTLSVLANTSGVFSIPEINIQYVLDVSAKIIKLTSNVTCTIKSIFGIV